MYCTRKVTEDIVWVGCDDRRLAMFEGVYSVPGGVSYNSYLIKDEKTVLLDTVDQAVGKLFLENVAKELDGRKLDYLVIQHIEPDHSATISDILLRYPEVTLICNEKTKTMLAQFYDAEMTERVLTVKEGDTLCTGEHTLSFTFAPMVHWPEVMVTYDSKDKILFSADAFGTFGALNGALFADEVDFFTDYLKEARRYYTNIVGKYGTMVQALLKKASALDIQMICPLHGPVWRENLAAYIEKYQLWSSYEPEERGVMIAYASVYGHTENAANILACALRDRGIKTMMYDVSVTHASDIIAEAFRYSHLVFASATYNGGIFVSMDELLRDLAAHGLKNRTVAVIQNGSWGAVSGRQMKEILSGMKDMNILEETADIKSSVKEEQRVQLMALADRLAESVRS
ncbi:MAG: FprA family A-type flavoprotein [Lachnospiraceae bacterium]